MRIRILTTVLLAATLLCSCSKEDNTPKVDGSPVQFSTEIATRASGTAWADGDAIGIFMKNASAEIATSEGLNASNVKYTNSASSFTSTTPIYYPMSGAVDFVAYYPWRTTPASDPYIYKVDVSTQTTPAAIDLLWSANATNKTKSKTAVALTFNHKLSRVVLNIKAGTGMTATELAGVTVKITGMPTKADFKLADGLLGTPTTVDNIVPIVATATSGYVATYTAIVVPQEASAWNGRKMVFTVGGTDYDYAIPEGDDFATGKNHTYNISVNEKSITVSRGTITDWTGIENSEGIGVEQLPKMALIPAGTFLMGSPTTEPNRDDTDETQHSVTLTQDFYMSKYAITNAQYAAFLNGYNAQNPGSEITGTENQGKYNTNGSHDGTWFSLPSSQSSWIQIEYATGKWQSKAGLGNHPFINVSHHGALAFCEFYGLRLPTEAEWEYACRGAYANKATETATLPFGIGDGSKLDYTNANFWWKYSYELPSGEYTDNTNTYPSKTQPVGSYTANNYGLYDMHGNVWEWCSDKCNWPIADYGNTAVTDPTGSETGTGRVLRGGYWYFSAQDCRSANRRHNNPVSRSNNVGFRVVFVP